VEPTDGGPTAALRVRGVMISAAGSGLLPHLVEAASEGVAVAADDLPFTSVSMSQTLR
jgi:hypothetical protein